MQKGKALSVERAAPMGLLCCRIPALINILRVWSSKLVRRRRAWWQGDLEGTAGVQAAEVPKLSPLPQTLSNRYQDCSSCRGQMEMLSGDSQINDKGKKICKLCRE